MRMNLPAGDIWGKKTSTLKNRSVECGVDVVTAR